MNTDKATVIITNWNYGMFLREAIESVLAQTMLPKEIIIADDASTDGSLEIAQEYVDKYPDLFRIARVAPTRAGLPKNLNFAVSLVETPWFCALAADDKFKPTYIERCAEFFDSDARLAIIYSDMEKFGNWSGVWQVSDWNEDILRAGNYINGHAFIKKSVFDEVHGYRPEVNGSQDFFEDFFLWIDIIDLKKGYYGRRVPEPLVMYRRHDFGHRTDRTDITKRSGI